MNYYRSVKIIERQYNTGDTPLLVVCDDLQVRVCKYARLAGVSANKLVCELFGALFAEAWGLNYPKCDFVLINKDHLPPSISSFVENVPCFGTQYQDDVIDINSNNFDIIDFRIPDNVTDILSIALFDFWLANEDRYVNNPNILYDNIRNRIVPIDNGGIFNTGNLQGQLSLLSSQDSIICPDVVDLILKHTTKEDILDCAIYLAGYFKKSIQKSKNVLPLAFEIMPKEWNINEKLFMGKFDELFSEDWEESVWEAFIDTVRDNLDL